MTVLEKYVLIYVTHTCTQSVCHDFYILFISARWAQIRLDYV